MRGHHVPHTAAAKAKMRASRLGKPQPSKYRPMMVRDDGITMYRCGVCAEFKPREDFYRDNRTSLGLTSGCKGCHMRTAIRTRSPSSTREHRVITAHNARARLMGCSGVLRIADVRKLRAYLGERCLRCGSAANLEWDHVVALASGGCNDITNLQRLCSPCNDSKHTKTADYRTAEQRRWVYEFRVVK